MEQRTTVTGMGGLSWCVVPPAAIMTVPVAPSQASPDPDFQIVGFFTIPGVRGSAPGGPVRAGGGHAHARAVRWSIPHGRAAANWEDAAVKMTLVALAALVLAPSPAKPDEGGKPRLLILTGQNNHNW